MYCIPFKTGQIYKGGAKMGKDDFDYIFTITSVDQAKGNFTFTQVVRQGDQIIDESGGQGTLVSLGETAQIKFEDSFTNFVGNFDPCFDRFQGTLQQKNDRYLTGSFDLLLQE